MINDPFHPDEAIERQKDSNRRVLLGIICAVALTALLLTGYGYFRSRHARQVMATSAQLSAPPSPQKGPPLANIVLDEPLLEKGTTVLKGAVKNISKQPLTGLAVVLELRKRKESLSEERVVPISPNTLQPDEEGTYLLKLPAQDYASLRLVSLVADPNSSSIAYSTSPGKKRPAERLAPQTIIVRSPTHVGEFINTPDNPGRLP
jgi:hypothetical protein